MSYSVSNLFDAAENAKKSTKFDLDTHLALLTGMLRGWGSDLNHPSLFAVGRDFGYIVILCESLDFSYTRLSFALNDGKNFVVNDVISCLNKMRVDLKKL